MLKTKKYSYIDSIRGYAVLMVQATHVFIYGGGKSNPDIAFANTLFQSRMGVMLFYMISALTLFLSFEQKVKVERYPVRNFFIRRFFRIVPLFYFVCVYMIIFFKFDLMSIIVTITFTNGFIPEYIYGIVSGGWSIAVESIFYLTVPVLFKYITSVKKSILFFFFSVLFAVLLRSLAFRYLSTIYSGDVLMTWTFYWLPMQLPVFGIGIFLYFCLFKSDSNITANIRFNQLLSYFLIFSSAYFFIIVSYGTRLFIYENIAFSFALMLFILGMAIYPGNYLNNKLMQFFGKISYSFYLLHPIVIVFTGETLLNKLGKQINPTVGFLICYVLMLGLTTLVSYLSYRFIEQPFQKLGLKLIQKSENRSIKYNMEINNPVDNTAI